MLFVGMQHVLKTGHSWHFSCVVLRAFFGSRSRGNHCAIVFLKTDSCRGNLFLLFSSALSLRFSVFLATRPKSQGKSCSHSRNEDGGKLSLPSTTRKQSTSPFNPRVREREAAGRSKGTAPAVLSREALKVKKERAAKTRSCFSPLFFRSSVTAFQPSS
ncbi:PCI domain-containing protein [Toxoplasma gondii CAST]|uniref:PCI domain-containing protein n=1 Tax=Toxoplasma gondii CAST TaxID=943122 RepID=A0A425HVC1_TOXGO|nr:PCI domain-containing protein [Toxoplasma gondii CAST]